MRTHRDVSAMVWAPFHGTPARGRFSTSSCLSVRPSATCNRAFRLFIAPLRILSLQPASLIGYYSDSCLPTNGCPVSCLILVSPCFQAEACKSWIPTMHLGLWASPLSVCLLSTYCNLFCTLDCLWSNGSFFFSCGTTSNKGCFYLGGDLSFSQKAKYRDLLLRIR